MLSLNVLVLAILNPYFVSEGSDLCTLLGGAISVKEKCYKKFNQELSWFDAQVGRSEYVVFSAYCRKELYRGTLAEIDNDVELNALKSIPKEKSLGFWLGASDLVKEGTFICTSTGRKIEKNSPWWAESQPDNTHNNEDCVNMFQTKELNDCTCNINISFVCQTVLLQHVPVVPALIKYQTAYLQVTSGYTYQDVSLVIQVHNGEDTNTIIASFAQEKSVTFYLDNVLLLNQSETYKSYVTVTSYQWVTVVLYVTDDQHKMIASTLVFPARMFVLLSEAYFVLPFHKNGTENTIDVVSMTNGSTEVAVYFIAQDFSARLNNDLYNASLSPYSMLVSRATLETQFETFHLNLVTDLKRGFLTASRPVAVFLSRSRPDTPEFDPSIDEMLPVEYIGTEYITFPSLPLTEVNDTFLLVAAHEDTHIQIPSLDANISLSSVGASRMVELSGGKFHFIQGDVGFYLYKRRSTDKENVCETSLLPKSWWSNQYDFTISSELASWMVYVVVVGNEAAFSWISSIGTTKVLFKYTTVGVSSSWGYIYNMTSQYGYYHLHINNSQATFGAYMYGTNERSTFCHPLGVADDLQPTQYKDKSNFKMQLIPAQQSGVNCGYTAVASTAPATSVTAAKTSSTPTIIENTTLRSSERTTVKTTSDNYNVTNVTNYTQDMGIRDTTEVTQPRDVTREESTVRHTQAIMTEEDLSTHSFSTDETTHTQTITTEGTTIHAQPTTTMEPAKQAEKLVNEIKKTLQVNSRNTSAFLRTKTSTEDPRPSATAVGYVGIVMLSTVFGTIVLFDLPRFFVFVKTLFKCNKKHFKN